LLNESTPGSLCPACRFVKVACVLLLGDASHYQGLVPQDLATLKAALDRAHAAGLKVVITPLSLPGMRWSQNNNNQFDGRLWQDAGCPQERRIIYFFL
jgi:hypothetical protein